MAEMQRRFSVTAWAVHAFSASGAVLALLAVLAIDGHRWTEAMLWLFAALVVDGIDGTFARAARVIYDGFLWASPQRLTSISPKGWTFQSNRSAPAPTLMQPPVQ